MKKLLLLLMLCMSSWSLSYAQLPDGSIAPDFTVTDVNLGGNTYSLSQLLAEGKTVFIDVFATWCGPCWNYHNGGALKTIYNTYGPNGTNEAMVIAVEADAATNIACIFGPSGCNNTTTGNWTAGTPYPICNDDAFNNLYNINYFPTIYMICPDGVIWEAGQLNATALWNFRQQKCSLGPASISTTSVTPVKCFGTNTGAINISVSGGLAPYTYLWSNNATSQDLNNVAAGDYSVTVTTSNNQQAVYGPITVEGPGEPLAAVLEDATPMGCNGVFASLTAGGTGGWGDYTFKWSTNSLEATIQGLNPGNYTVTVTDNLNCTKTATFNVAPAILPTAAIAPPGTVTCAQSAIQLNGTGSSSGANIAFLWTASNGGNIVSGATTATPTINAGGLYNLKVTNADNNCSSFANASVSANNTPPVANAGGPQSISCTQSSITLQGTASTGSNFSYLWTSSNGGNITSGASTLTPVVNAAGTYTLNVTNSTNGCTQSSAAVVTGIAAPVVNTANGAITCQVASVNLTTTTNAANPGFSWTGPNNFSSTAQSPTVNVPGSYTLVVLDSITGCSKTITATVAQNTTAPGATATGGAITCLNTAVVLNGSSPDTTASYAWTGPNGFTSTLPNPSVTTDGVYSLAVTTPANGCVSTASATVALNNAAPVAAASTPGNLNCNNAQIQINGTASSQGQGIAYAWTTATGNIVSGANTLTPVVDLPGTYTLQVSNSDNGCTASTTAAVVLNTPVQAPAAVQNNVSCFGGANGAAQVVASGGTGAYTYQWSNNATTAAISGLTAGTYVVIVTDAENCTATASVDVQEPTQLAANASSTAQSANGLNDGAANAAPTGGAPGYSYTWSNGETTAAITGLAPGAYTVTVGDQNGCISVQTVNVNAFNCALASNITSANVSCFGAANGSATVVLNGAADPVAYTWSNGATAASVSGLTPGEYTVNVLDANNCPAVLNVLITEPAQLNANATAVAESSAGGNNGSASANPVGGTAAYTYAWSNGATDSTISGLAPGVYTVVVTDANNCTSEQTVNVAAFSCALLATTSVANVNCAGNANGSVNIALQGAANPVTYVWSNGATTAGINNLAGGEYTVVITDDNGCSTVASATVTEPAPFTALNIISSAPACANDPSGSAAASLGGGVEPYTYAWSNGATTALAENLTAGTYTVVVTDQNNCQVNGSVTIVATDAVAPTVSVQNATLSLNASGTAAVSAAALSVVAADNCAVASTSIEPATFDCDQLGTHVVTVTVTDASGLTATATATVNVVDDLAPVLTCPNSITACFADNIVSYAAPVAVDNCLLSGGEWTLDSGLPSGSAFPVGVTTQQYSFKDASGNNGTCSFEVIVTQPVDFQDPIVTDDVNNQGQGAIIMNLSGGVAPLSFEWTLNEVIVGTTQNLTGLVAGDYQLYIIDGAGCEYATTVKVGNTTSANEPAWLSGVRLQPNPTSGITRVLFSRIPESNLETLVIDATGRVLLSQISDNQAVITLDCQQLPAGMYTIRFRTGTETGVRKLVINR
jgi:hypothetical protein